MHFYIKKNYFGTHFRFQKHANTEAERHSNKYAVEKDQLKPLVTQKEEK